MMLHSILVTVVTVIPVTIVNLQQSHPSNPDYTTILIQMTSLLQNNNCTTLLLQR